MATQSNGFYLCIDGPLRGELHGPGARFGFDGRVIGEECGFYELEDDQYHWHADTRSVVLVQSSHRTTLSSRSRFNPTDGT
jgi:hypothetical protein